MLIKLKWWFNRAKIQNTELNFTFLLQHGQTRLQYYNVWLFSRESISVEIFTVQCVKSHRHVGGRQLLQLVCWLCSTPTSHQPVSNTLRTSFPYSFFSLQQIRGGFFDNFSEWKGHQDGESGNDAVARSIVGKQLPPGTLDEERPLFLQNS